MEDSGAERMTPLPPASTCDDTIQNFRGLTADASVLETAPKLYPPQRKDMGLLFTPNTPEEGSGESEKIGDGCSAPLSPQ